MSIYLIECVKAKFYHSFVHHFHNLCQLSMSSRHFHSQKRPVGVTHRLNNSPRDRATGELRAKFQVK